MGILKNLRLILSMIIEAETKRIADQNTISHFYAECGKRIFEIENCYPASHEDAEAVFEEWCKGFLSECRPSLEDVREYAKFTADRERFIAWMRSRNKDKP